MFYDVLQRISISNSNVIIQNVEQAKSSEIDFDYVAYASQRLNEFKRLVREAGVAET